MAVEGDGYGARVGRAEEVKDLRFAATQCNIEWDGITTRV